MRFHEALNKAIELRNTSQTELACEMLVTKAYINQLCTGAKIPSLQKIIHICDILNFKVSEFIALGE